MPLDPITVMVALGVARFLYREARDEVKKIRVWRQRRASEKAIAARRAEKVLERG